MRFICLLACFNMATVIFAGEIEISFKSSFDKSEQKAMAYIPETKNKAKRPLLVVAHYMGGNRFTAKVIGYYPEMDKRDCLLVCPELHGKRSPGAISCAALEAQHDIIDSIEYMKKHYSVDESRIYIAGRSMGGMLTQIMLAKYPDLFAAGVAGQGVSNLETLKSTAGVENSVVKECGSPKKNKFDYQRRSSVNYAPNFNYVPLIMWHGTNDIMVPPEQSENLFNEIKKYNRFQKPVYWLVGASHCEANYPPSWICDQLQYYQNKSSIRDKMQSRFFSDLRLVTDEAKRFFWLTLTPEAERFGSIHAVINPGGMLKIKCENLTEVAVDLELVSGHFPIKRYQLESTSNTKLIIRNKNSVLLKVSGKTLSGTL